MVNPFNISQVDIPGVFGAVQQFRSNALNFQIGQEQLAAARAERETQGQLRNIRAEAVAGDPSAAARAFVIDPDAGKDMLNFAFAKTKESRAEGQERREQAVFMTRGLAGIATNVLRSDLKEGAPIPEQFLEEALRLGIDENQIPKTFNRQQFEGFVLQSNQFAGLLDAAIAGKASFIRFNKQGEQEVATARPGSPEARELEREGFVQGTRPRIEAKAPVARGGLTKSQVGEEQADFRVLKNQVAQMAGLVERIKAVSKESGAKALSLSASLLRGLDTIVTQVKALGDLYGEGVKDVSTNPDDYDFSAFNLPADAAQAARMKTLTTWLGYLFATVNLDPGGRLDKEAAQRGIDIVGGSTGSPEQLAAMLDEVLRGSFRKLRAFAANSPNIDFDQDEFIKINELNIEPSVLARSGGGEPVLVSSQAEVDALPSGAKFRETPDGPIFVKPEKQ